MSPVVEAWSPNHWTAREFSRRHLLYVLGTYALYALSSLLQQPCEVLLPYRQETWRLAEAKFSTVS